MTVQRCELKSPNYGSVLVFAVRERLKGEITFDVSVETPSFSGVASSSTYMALPLADLFREMAAEWAGWVGEKTWSDLERCVEISARSDRTGHITLRITLSSQDGDTQLRTSLKFDAGQLESFAEEVSVLFG